MTFRLVSELCQTKVLMVLIHHLVSVESKWAFIYIFFNARKVDNLFDNPALFKKVEKVFLIP